MLSIRAGSFLMEKKHPFKKSLVSANFRSIVRNTIYVYKNNTFLKNQCYIVYYITLPSILDLKNICSCLLSSLFLTYIHIIILDLDQSMGEV